MIAFVGFDPAVFPVIDRVGRLARIKDREKFRLLMMEVVNAAHRVAGSNPKLLEGAPKARQLIDKLDEVLDANPNLSRRLGWRMEAFGDLSEGLHKLEQFKKQRPKKWAMTIRWRFVNDLLDAVHHAGGDLGLDSRNGGGKLVEAIAELRRYLPDEFRHGLSASTLKNIKAARPKNRKK
jgi:hypothetical protein